MLSVGVGSHLWAGGIICGQGASLSLKWVGWLMCGWYRSFVGVINDPGWGADAHGRWGHRSWIWMAGSLWLLLGVCLCGRCRCVLGAVIVGVVGVVGVVIVVGIVVFVVILAVGIGISRHVAVVVIIVVEAVVMVVMCDI